MIIFCQNIVSMMITGLVNGNGWHKGHAIDSVDHPADMGEIIFMYYLRRGVNYV